MPVSYEHCFGCFKGWYLATPSLKNNPTFVADHREAEIEGSPCAAALRFGCSRIDVEQSAP